MSLCLLLASENLGPRQNLAVHIVHEETYNLRIKFDNTASRDLAPYTNQRLKTLVHVDVLRRMFDEPTRQCQSVFLLRA